MLRQASFDRLEVAAIEKRAPVLQDLLHGRQNLLRLPQGVPVAHNVAVPAVGPLPPVLTDGVAAAVPASMALPPVMAHAAATAVPAVAALPPVLAGAAPAALHALVLHTSMSAYDLAHARFAAGALPPVFADGAGALSFVFIPLTLPF